MKDILLDVVKHTHSLGFIDLVKVVGDDKSTPNVNEAWENG